MSRPAASTRDRLVHAARELFYERGYHDTGLADICRRAEVNAGSLYYFFKTKEELLLAVLEAYRHLLRPMVIEPAFAQSEDPIERIFALLAQYRRGLELTDCTSGCPIGNLALELGDTLPAARELIAANFAGWVAEVTACLEAAADRLPRGLDRARLGRFVLTVMEGGIMQARADRSLEPFDDCVAQLRDYFDRLLRESASPKRRPRRVTGTRSQTRTQRRSGRHPRRVR